MKRVISLWFPRLATDRLARRSVLWRTRPAATISTASGGPLLAAVNEPAHRAGLRPGQRLTDARALLPELLVAAANGEADRALLERLAEWCDRYTPWVALDETDPAIGIDGAGLWLDITGCSHLFGGGDAGEQHLFEDLLARLQGHGFTCRGAIADTPGAAWAAARFAERRESLIVAPAGQREALADLPMAGLRLPAETIETLYRLGLRRIGDLYPMARGPLASRFGTLPLQRLDQALGREDESIEPRRPAPPFRTRIAFAEPVGRAEDVTAAAGRLLDALCRQLEHAGMGARRLELVAHRVDGTLATAAIGTSQPSRDPAHLLRLFGDSLGQIDCGFGVELIMLAARAVDPFAATQAQLDDRALSLAGAAAQLGQQVGHQVGQAVGELVDRLATRLGSASVFRLIPRASHVPERATRRQAAMDGTQGGREAGGRAAGWRDADWTRHAAAISRPVRLLTRPEPIDVTAPVPDDPPMQFRWRRETHRVVRTDGPERLANEWWRSDRSPVALVRDNASVRDYYRIEDEGGRRYWIYRDGPLNGLPGAGANTRWFLHGFCA